MKEDKHCSMDNLNGNPLFYDAQLSIWNLSSLKDIFGLFM